MAVEETKNNEEAEIKRVIEGGVEAIRAKDLDGIMSMYAPELVSFDIVPPLQYVGADAYRKQWEEVFSSFPGPIDYEIADLSITVGDDVAFTHSFNRLSATMNNGQKIGNWLRWTACWRSIKETIQKRVLVMPLSPFYWVLMVQPYQDTIYKITGRSHHLIPGFALEANYVLLLLSSAFVAFSQNAY